jgi:hypothetical protein
MNTSKPFLGTPATWNFFSDTQPHVLGSWSYKIGRRTKEVEPAWRPSVHSMYDSFVLDSLSFHSGYW